MRPRDRHGMEQNMTEVMPRIEVWPACPTCEAAYVLRRSISVSTGRWEWLWQRDCKHKSPPVARSGPDAPVSKAEHDG